MGVPSGYTSAQVVQAVPSNNVSAWTDFTPTFTNLTQGNGTLTARYIQVGKLVTGYLSFIFGTTSSISGSVSFTLPVNMSTSYPQTRLMPFGTVNFEDDGTQTYLGFVGGYRDLQKMFVHPYNVGATYATQSNLSSTVPFTWGNLDAILVSFTYEAA